MTNRLLPKIAILAAAGVTMAGAASAGTWQLNANKCPDLIEDRIDRRVTTSRADLREDIRDERVINCPASAWYYVPSAGERRVKSARYYTGPRTVYVNRKGQYRVSATHKGQSRVSDNRRAKARTVRPIRVNVVIR